MNAMAEIRLAAAGRGVAAGFVARQKVKMGIITNGFTSLQQTRPGTYRVARSF